MTADTTTRHPNGHDAHRIVGDADAQCPYCGASISRNEFKEIRERIEGEERARIAKVEQTLKDKFSREQQQAAIKAKAEIEKAQKDAAKVAETKIKAIRATQDATIAARVQAAREAADKKLAMAVNAEKVKAFEEKTRLTEQLAEMQRKLEQRSAHAISEPAEMDLFEALKKEFPVDVIARVPRFQAGADIIHDVVNATGIVAGRIVYDSKAHARWQNRFTAKLRQDMIAHNADHAILSSTAFPAGARQLHLQNGVIVAAPARVVILSHILRRQILATHVLRLGSSDRDEKRDKLYEFITSEQCSQLLDQFAKLADDMIDLEVREVNSHQSVWRKRGELIRGIQRAHEDFASAIGRIIGNADPVYEEIVQ